MVEKRHEQLGLNEETVLDMYRTMLLSRRIDERMWLLNRSGKIPFVISCKGKKLHRLGLRLRLIGKRIMYCLIIGMSVWY